MDTDVVVIGLALIVVGMLAAWLCCLASLLILVGLVILVIGLLKSDPRAPSQYYMPAQPAPAYSSQPQGQMMYCPHCGRPHAPHAAWCPYCGKNLGKK